MASDFMKELQIVGLMVLQNTDGLLILRLKSYRFISKHLYLSTMHSDDYVK